MEFDVLDLTPLYLQHAARHPQVYFAAYPVLFEHYFRFWAESEAVVSLSHQEVQRKVELFRKRLPSIRENFTCAQFDDSILVVLFVGSGTTNGHAFWDHKRGSFVVWFPIEAYSTPLQVDVFVTHEMIHALHYTRYPEFYFTDVRAKYLVGRQVVTEGLATWGTMEIIGCTEEVALWADYVASEFIRSWYRQCGEREREMALHILREWNESSERNEWFTLWDARDVTRYRGGYYMGLRAIQTIHQRYAQSLSDLLSTGREQMEAMVQGVLEDMALGSGSS